MRPTTEARLKLEVSDLVHFVNQSISMHMVDVQEEVKHVAESFFKSGEASRVIEDEVKKVLIQETRVIVADAVRRVLREPKIASMVSKNVTESVYEIIISGLR